MGEITLKEFLFLTVMSHIYVLWFIRTFEMNYEMFVFELNVFYFLGVCLYYGIRCGWYLAIKIDQSDYCKERRKKQE